MTNDEVARLKAQLGFDGAIDRPRYPQVIDGGLGKALAVVPQSEPMPMVKKQRNTETVLAELNTRHAVIENIGNRCMISGWEPSALDTERLEIVFQKKESFLLRYSNQYITTEYVDEASGETKTRQTPLGQWWLTNRRRQQYRGVTFKPEAPKVVNECLNLWRGWGVTPVQGNWGLIFNHIHEVIASGDSDIAEYVVKWLAWSIQNPGKQAEVALVLIGEKGTGKGTVGRVLQRIFGDHAFQVTSNQEVIGKFNGHLQDCVVLIADEAYWGGDKRCIGRLQGMITEPTIPIERKGMDLIQVPNMLHIVMMAEPGWVIPAGRYERRYAAVNVSIKHRRDTQYFKALHNQIAGAGPAAMMYDLQVMDLGDWHPREIPDALLESEALRGQQNLSLPPLQQWYLGILHEGRLPGAIKPNTTKTKDLMIDAQQKFPRLKWDLSSESLRNFLVGSRGQIGIEADKYRHKDYNGWSFPTLAECRAAWEAIHGYVAWDDPEAEWCAPTIESKALPMAKLSDEVRALIPPKPAKFDVKAILDAAESARFAKESPAVEAESPPHPTIIIRRR